MSSSCDPDYKDAQFAFYRYEPSLGAAVVFTIIFVVTTILHTFQMIKTKTWYLIAFVLGGACEILGFIGRAIGANEEAGCWTLPPYILQSTFILIGPALMAASIYMVLARIIVLTDGQQYALIKRRFLTKIFVAGDVLALILQAQGGGLMSMAGPDNNFMEMGEIIIIVGLFIQLACFGTFVVVSAVFHRRMNRAPTPKALQTEIRWRDYLRTLYVASGLIWVRSLFRVIEYLEGNDGYLISHEVYIYVFDALLIATTMLWMNWYHPGEIGLLLRGEEINATNGLQLVGVGRKNGTKGRYRESLTSVDSSTASRSALRTQV
ncbi:hypothetical protein QQX98_005100 [Neonectria punicea]|uniref:Uncharacterized protein n=1 Tax=Neonectria punicea TaxID=979145 RepID=A0ABR1H6T7_9HYPO